ncbi:MAG: nickel/cobalt transporter [Nitrososphaerota archaeon]
MVEAAYFAVVFIGMLHGLEPGHGWPLAMLYVTNPRSEGPPSRTLKAFVSSMVISGFHLTSSLAVVVAYAILKSVLDSSLPYLDYVAGAALLFLGIKYLLEKPKQNLKEQHGHFHDDFEEGEHEHEHEHHGGIRHTHLHRHTKAVLISLWSIAVSAFFLGFAHEEEFALLALAVGGVEPLALMLTYGLAVAAGLVGITLVAVRVYSKVEEKLKRYEKIIPKLSGVVLLIMAVSFLTGLR